MREVERLDVGVLDALCRQPLAGVGEREVDLLLSRSVVALGGSDGDKHAHAGCRAWVGTGVVPQPQPSHIPKCTGCSPVKGPSTSRRTLMAGKHPRSASESSSAGMGTTAYAE